MVLTFAAVIDPAIGFALGVNYWYSYAITLPTELTAAAIVIQYWNTSINVAAWITILYVLILAINFMGVRWYGEFEFWFSAIKITTIVGLIILGIAIDCGAGPAGTGYIGFRYWKNPGPFNQVTINGGDGVIPGSWGRKSAIWAERMVSDLNLQQVSCPSGTYSSKPRSRISELKLSQSPSVKVSISA